MYIYFYYRDAPAHLTLPTLLYKKLVIADGYLNNSLALYRFQGYKKSDIKKVSRM